MGRQWLTPLEAPSTRSLRASPDHVLPVALLLPQLRPQLQGVSRRLTSGDREVKPGLAFKPPPPPSSHSQQAHIWQETLVSCFIS